LYRGKKAEFEAEENYCFNRKKKKINAMYFAVTLISYKLHTGSLAICINKLVIYYIKLGPSLAFDNSVKMPKNFFALVIIKMDIAVCATSKL
jgi:hypothetical protein